MEIGLSVKMIACFTLILGIGYPMMICVVGQVAFPREASGSIIKINGVARGSARIGQSFTKPQYFHGRPSACEYSAMPSYGSNLATSSKLLREQMLKRENAIIAENGLDENSKIPADLLTASASGLDPNITVEAAMIQVARIAKARGRKAGDIKYLVKKQANEEINLYGEKNVNVLKLNLLLDGEKY